MENLKTFGIIIWPYFDQVLLFYQMNPIILISSVAHLAEIIAQSETKEIVWSHISFYIQNE